MKTPNSPSRPRRFEPEFKKAVVLACKKPGASVATVAIDFRVNSNVVRRWIREFDWGIEWHSPAKPRKYIYRPTELKQKVIAQCREAGAIVSEIAASHGINPNLVRVWLRRSQAMPQSPSLPLSPVEWQPVVVTDEAPKSVTSSPVQWPPVIEAEPPSPVIASVPVPETAQGQIKIELNGARLQLRGAVDLKALRVVMEALRR